MPLTPKIRFRDEKNNQFPDWEAMVIGDFLSEKSVKQVPTEEAPLMAFVAHKGVTEKGEKYDRSHLVKNKNKKYKRTDINDFIYSSNNLDVGSIGLNKYGSAVISDVYEIFSINNNANPDFINEVIQRPANIDKIIQFRQGCLYGQYKIYPESFLDVEINMPVKEEQDKIADFLSLYNKMIETQELEIEALEMRRRGLLQRIFSQEIRFKADNGINYPDWEDTLLSDILTERKLRSTGSEEVYSVSVAKGLVNQIEHLGRSFAAADTSKYKLVKPGDVVYTKSPTGDFKWGIVKQSKIDKDVIVSPLYGIFIPKSYAFGFIVDAYFSSNVRAHNYLITQIRKGAKNTINITNDVFLAKEICLPTSEEEAIKIQKFIELLDKQIQIEKDKLEAIKLVKKGLLQQMFV